MFLELSKSVYGVAWPNLGGWVCYNLVSDLSNNVYGVAWLGLGGWVCYNLVSEL
jgi:hypothetical protein